MAALLDFPTTVRLNQAIQATQMGCWHGTCMYHHVFVKLYKLYIYILLCPDASNEKNTQEAIIHPEEYPQKLKTSEAVRKLRKQYRRFVFRLTRACSWQGVHESCAPQLDLDSTCLKSQTNFFRGKLQSFTKGTNKANSRGEI